MIRDLILGALHVAVCVNYWGFSAVTRENPAQELCDFDLSRLYCGCAICDSYRMVWGSDSDELVRQLAQYFADAYCETL